MSDYPNISIIGVPRWSIIEKIEKIKTWYGKHSDRKIRIVYDEDELNSYSHNNAIGYIDLEILESEALKETFSAEDFVKRFKPQKAPAIKRDEKGYPLLENGKVDWGKLSEEKESEREKYERIERGSSRKPHKKHATNYTPPKRKRK